MADVFISYSRREEEFVLSFARALEEGGRDVWRDKDDIPPAVAWEEEIRRGIDSSNVVVFVLSEGSLASSHCRDELDHALSRNKTIVPLVRRDLDGAVVPEALARLNYVFARDGDDQAAALAAVIAAVDGLPEHVRLHTRVLARAAEWDADSRNGARLLTGRELRDADEWLAQSAGKEPPPTTLHHEYVLASRRRASRRQRLLVGASLAAVVVTALLAVAALLQRNEAQRQRDEAVRLARIATSRALAAQSTTSLELRPELAALLALEAFDSATTFEARDALVTAVQRTGQLDWIVPTRATAVALSPNGRTLLTGHADGRVVVWEVARRRAAGRPLRVSSAPVSRLVFAPDGRTVAVAARAAPVSLWNVGERRRIGVLGKREADDIAFSPDGRLVALVSSSRITLWDVGRLERLRRVGRFPTAGKVAFSPDGKTLASTELDDHRTVPSDTVVRLWDVESGRQLGRALRLGPSPGYVPSGVAFSPDGRLLAAATLTSDLSNPGVLRVWDVARRRQLGETVTAESGGVTAVAFGRDGTLVTAATRVQSWTPGSFGLVERPGSPFGAMARVTDVAVVARGRLAALGADGAVGLSSLTGTWALGEQLAGKTRDAALSADGSVVAAAGAVGGITLFDVRSRRALGTPLAPGSSVSALAVSADGDAVASGDDGGKVDVRRVADRRPLREPLRLGVGFYGMLLAPSGGALVALDYDRVWYAPLDGGRARSLTGSGVRAAAFSPAGDTLALGDGDGRIAFWDGAGRRRRGALVPAHDGAVSSLAFSPDGRTLASVGEDDGMLRLWDTASRRPSAPAVKVAEAGLSSIAFASGGTVALGIRDLSFVLWDLAQRRPLGEPLRLADYATLQGGAPIPDLGTAVAFDRHGRVLATTGGQALVLWKPILWSRSAAPFRQRLCSVAGRNLTAPEWRAFLPGQAYRKTCARWPGDGGG